MARSRSPSRLANCPMTGTRPNRAAAVSSARSPSRQRATAWATRASSPTRSRESTAPVVTISTALWRSPSTAALPVGTSSTYRSGGSMPWIRHSPSTVLWSRGNSSTVALRPPIQARTRPEALRATGPTTSRAMATPTSTATPTGHPATERRTVAGTATTRPVAVAGERGSARYMRWASVGGRTGDGQYQPDTPGRPAC